MTYPSNMLYEKYVDLLFMNLRMESFTPNRKWIKESLCRMHIFVAPSPGYYDAIYKAFKEVYLDYISEMGDPRNINSVATSSESEDTAKQEQPA